ncbi:MAG: 1,4-dihydroxy-2-naphthoate polyprenyltransferase [Myxococcota bacterium]|nr:1,4-dihydroxy-2-naphthoate polyprenyltransferase [Myxococcota bacterium]
MAAWKRWLLASRPATLTAAFVPVFVGSALCWQQGKFHAASAAIALLGALLIQLGTNYANDLHDFLKGTDDENRLGPTRAVQAGLISIEAMRRAMVITFLLAFLFGLLLVWRAGWPIALLGLFSILSGWAYTGGPYPLGYHGLGDLFVFLFFGFAAVVGTYYVQCLEAPLVAWYFSIPVGASCTAIIVVNNLRDREGDEVSGKRTLAVRWGARWTRRYYVGLLLSATFATPLYLLHRPFSWFLLAPLLLLPFVWYLARALQTSEGEALNPVLAKTAGFHLVLGLVIGASLMLSGGS